jgi:putative oxidoreductase
MEISDPASSKSPGFTTPATRRSLLPGTVQLLHKGGSVMAIDGNAVLSIMGRLLLGGLFVYGGIHHLFNISGLTHAIAARGMPAAKTVLLFGTGLQTIAGLALILDVYTYWAAWSLIVFTIAASILLVNFWDMEGEAREGAVRAWWSNSAIIGGLLIAAASSR